MACVTSGSSFADTANTMLVPARVLGDAAIHYEWQNWRFAVNVANIADKIYVAGCSTANAYRLQMVKRTRGNAIFSGRVAGCSSHDPEPASFERRTVWQHAAGAAL